MSALYVYLLFTIFLIFFNVQIPSDEWSLSLWLFLAETPYSQHRTLFYKGDFNSSRGRSPSVWLLPNSKKLVVQTSSEENFAISTNSMMDVQKMKWQLLTFVFRNNSALEHSASSGGNSDKEEARLQGYEIISSNNDLSTSNTKINAAKEYNYSIQIYQNDVLDIRWFMGVLRLYEFRSFENCYCFLLFWLASDTLCLYLEMIVRLLYSKITHITVHI